MDKFKIRIQDVDLVIWGLLIPLLIVDSINGIFYENNISIPFSISQIYKLGIVALFFIRLLKTPKYILFIWLLLGLMIVPSILQWTKETITFNVVIQDLIFSFKYLTVLISFFYFKEVLATVNKSQIPKYFVWIKLSYFILAISLSLKLVGIGYPMYTTGNIGARGFFIAGNEISALLLILSGLIAYYYWVVNRNIWLFIGYGLTSFILGLLISSKTGILGILLVYMLIVLGTTKFNFKDKRVVKSLVYTLLVVMVFAIGISLFIQNSAIMTRYAHFWDKMDFITFILSSRNIYLAEMIPIFENSYSSLERLIGIGNFRFEELANQKIEIDILDILFTYGYLGILLFGGLLALYFFSILKVIKQRSVFVYAKLSFILFTVLFLLSCLSGHIFNSGIAGVFIGFVFSLAYYKKVDG